MPLQIVSKRAPTAQEIKLTPEQMQPILFSQFLQDNVHQNFPLSSLNCHSVIYPSMQDISKRLGGMLSAKNVIVVECCLSKLRYVVSTISNQPNSELKFGPEEIIEQTCRLALLQLQKAESSTPSEYESTLNIPPKTVSKPTQCSLQVPKSAMPTRVRTS